MKIINNKETKSRINELVEINDLNMSLSEIFLSILGKYDDAIIKNIKNSSNEKETFLNEIADCLEIDLSNEEDEKIWKERISKSIIEIDPKEYENNPYNKNINFNNVNFGKYSLKRDCYVPYEIFPLCDVTVDKKFNEITKLAYFKKQYSFPVLNENNVTWMSVNPNEVETMKDAITLVNGNVLVYGLGLGYFAYMISLKNDVNKITIIEKDLNIIKLFKENILPQFKNPQKIEIIYMDAFDFKTNSSNFNYAFVDLWHSADDGIKTYLKFKQNEDKNIKYLYWIENSFYALLRRAFITLIFEQFNNKNGSNYTKESNTFDWLINTYYKKTKNITISTRDDLDKLLTNEKLIELIII